MTTYYIDNNATYAANHANDGSASLPWGGAGGLQRAFGRVAPGETINIKAGTTVAASTVIRVVCTGTQVGAFAVDDYVYCYEFNVTPQAAEASGGQGYILAESPAKTFYISVAAGTWVTGAAHCITNIGKTVYIEAITVGKPGLTPLVDGTLAGGRITITGCNSSWAVDGTRVVLSGTDCTTVIAAGASAYYDYRWLTCSGSSSHGLNSSSGTSNAYDCIVTNCGSAGLYITGVRCQISLCSFGTYTALYDSIVKGCSTMACTTAMTLQRCVICGNTAGVDVPSYANLQLFGCVIDGNLNTGITIASTGGIISRVMFSRISNNGDSAGEYGLSVDTAAHGVAVLEDYNVFFNNGTDGAQHRNNVAAGPNSVTATTNAQLGYADVKYTFSYDGGDEDKTLAVGEDIVNRSDGTTVRGVVTAQTEVGAGATGTCTINAMQNGVIANNQGLEGATSGKHIDVNGTFSVAASPNYNITNPSAVLRRTAISLDGVNVIYATAGLTPAALPPPAGEVVLNGTAYEGATGAVAASGTRTDAAVADVKAGVKYGDPGSQLTGEYAGGGGGVGVRYGGALRGA